MTINRWWTCACLSTTLVLAACGGNAPTAVTAASTASVGNLIPSLQPYATPTGTVATFSATGSIDPSGIFFQALGTNPRSCASCHRLSQGMSIGAAATQALFATSGGADPLFNAVDGANCPGAAAGDAGARSLLLNNGLIRVGREVPAAAQFHAVASQDPYGCAESTDFATGQPVLSVYRRPLPTAGLTFLSSVMWDARATSQPLNQPATYGANLSADLAAQAADAVATHEQGSTALTSAQLADLVAFERGLYSAEASDTQAGALDAGAAGGAATLAAQAYTPGVNDPGPPGSAGAFNPVVFTLFQAWRNSANPAQASIARGEDIFNTAPLVITGVRGLNDNPALGSPAAIPGSCSTCHDTPNVGSRSLPLTMDTGTSHVASNETDPGVLAGLAQLTAPSLPIYQITGCADAGGHPVTYVTTDPGQGLTTGLCADVNRVKIPGLRGLAARAPYFHNGSAATLQAVVNFYAARFRMRLTPQQRQDLANFLGAL